MFSKLSKRLDDLRARDNQSGFTLIELLIVIVILGVLAAVVVFSVQGITDRGNTAACKSNVATINTAVEAYYAKNSSYPTSDADLTTAPNQFMQAPVPAGYITYNGAATAPTVKSLNAC